MSIVILGGLDRLKRKYEKSARDMGFDVKVFSQRVPNFGERMSKVGGIVIFTGTVAHHMVNEAKLVARKYKIPVGRSHTSGVSGLKRCLVELAQTGR